MLDMDEYQYAEQLINFVATEIPKEFWPFVSSVLNYWVEAELGAVNQK